VNALVEVSGNDLPFADRYLDRATAYLDGLCSRERFHALESERVAVGRLTTAIRDATDRGQWQTVQTLAHQAASLRVGMVGSEELVRLGAEVHGSRTFHPTAIALAFAGVLDVPDDAVERARSTMVERLRELVRRDGEWAAFYGDRAAWFERLKPAGVAHVENDVAVDRAAARKRIVEAVERDAFGEIESLAATLSKDTAKAAGHRRPVLALATGDLAAPFPAESVARAARLGLTMEILERDACIDAAVACRLTGHGVASSDLPHTCPPAMRPALCDNLAVVLQHSIVSSAGRRYIPSFGPEVILVESFPETEPDARTALLDVLDLSRRRGLARIEIEDALGRHTAAVCELLGLDPFAFTVACIPFDVYVRLAPRLGWGQQTMWTHFDGYEVGSALELRALVGGDVRYGAGHDLCMVGRRYDGVQLTARFVVVRRSRLAAA
jgi:hypothetical protein